MGRKSAKPEFGTAPECEVPERWYRDAVDEIRALRAENERLRAHIEKGHGLVNDMDLRMPEQATEDADGWINSYRTVTTGKRDSHRT